jgi:hypothetical protein
MSVCGVPTLSWPYACDIDAANGLNFDAGTGRLWVRPQVPTQVYNQVPTFLSLPGITDVVSPLFGDVLRVWAAGASIEYGPAATFDLTTRVDVTVTNTSCLPWYVRGTVRFPQVRFQSTYQTTKFGVIAAGYYGAEERSSAVIAHDGDPSALVQSPGYPFNAGFPKVFGIESAVADLFDALPTGLLNIRFPAHNVDLFGGFRTLAPGATIVLGYKLIARSSGTHPITVGGVFPDFPFMASYADVYDAGRLTVEAHA